MEFIVPSNKLDKSISEILINYGFGEKIGYLVLIKNNPFEQQTLTDLLNELERCYLMQNQSNSTESAIWNTGSKQERLKKLIIQEKKRKQ